MLRACARRVSPCCVTALLLLMLSLAPAPAAAEEMIVTLRVNGLNRGEAIVDTGSDGAVTLSADDAKKLGFTQTALERLLGADMRLTLNADRRLQVRLDTNSLTLDLDAPPDWFAATVVSLSSRAPTKVTQLPGWHGWFNYALDMQYASDAAVAARMDTQMVLARNGWSLYSEQSLQGLLTRPSWRRNGTTLFFDDSTALTRFSLGDVAPGPGLGTTVTRLRGLQWSRRYDIDPSVIVGPAFAWQYNVTSPSTVDVFVDQTRVRSVSVAPGPLNLADLTYFPGLRNVDVVVRNRAGAETRIAVPYYFASDMLASGRSTFDLAAGQLVDSPGGPRLAASAAGRYGLTDRLTAGAGLEVQSAYRMARVEATARDERWGQASAQVATSRRSADSPWQQAVSIGYSMIRDRVSVQTNFLAQQTGFGREQMPSGATRLLKRQYSGAVALAISPQQSVSMSLAVSDFANGARESMVGTRLSHNWGRGLSAWLALSGGRQATQVTGSIAVGLTIALGPRWSVSNSAEARKHEGAQMTVRAARSGNDDGWNNLRLSAATRRDVVSAEGYVERATGFSTIALAARAEQRGHATELAGNARASGALVLADGELWASQTVSQAFALVDVPKAASVRVYHNGQLAGRTNDMGRVIVPNLAAYAANQLRLDDRDIPLDVELAAVQQEVAPRTFAGTFVRFANRTVSALAGTLVLHRGGAAAPVVSAQLSASRIDGTAEPIMSTTDGQGGFYLDALTPGRWRIAAINRTIRCVAEVEMNAGPAVFTELGEVPCRTQ